MWSIEQWNATHSKLSDLLPDNRDAGAIAGQGGPAGTKGH